MEKNNIKVLIAVDPQNDFMPGGALAVAAGNEVAGPISRLLPIFDVTVVTKDWHPRGHGSFASAHGKDLYEMGELGGLPQRMWPDHCIQGTFGAALGGGLLDSDFDCVVQKGESMHIDSYSGFFDNDKKNATGLDSYLKEVGATELYICGLATDYCVMATVLDALALGYSVTVVTDACRAVNIAPDDGEKAITEMVAAGAKLTTSQALLQTA